MAWLKSLKPAAVVEELKGRIASLQQQWRGSRRENEQLREENEQLREQREELEKERDRLREEDEKLKQQLEQALRASKRQAAPFSRGQRKQNLCEAKLQFADWLKSTSGISVDPDTIFDSQIKRIHEYKRQLLNALRIVVDYNRLRQNPELVIAPRTFLFAGKAAPAYHLAKLIIK